MSAGDWSFEEGPIEGVVLRPLASHMDARGWLVELFRQDELDAASHPVMGYASLTLPGVARGPHAHRRQSDLFSFIGPGDLKLYLWDTREGSPTAGHRQTLAVGQSNRVSLLIPAGVVHAYRTVGPTAALVLNFSNGLYRGPRRTEPVDEIRYEDQPQSPFVLD